MSVILLSGRTVIQKLTTFVSRAHELSHEIFVEGHPHPVLVVPPFHESGPLVFTQALPLSDADTPHAGSGDVGVALIQKRSGANPFGAFITIGRAKNNDIVLNDGEVSKVHAYLVQDPNGNWMLRDAPSTNGTFINTLAVGSSSPTMLNSKDTISFGKQVVATFLSPSDFYSFLRAD